MSVSTATGDDEGDLDFGDMLAAPSSGGEKRRMV